MRFFSAPAFLLPLIVFLISPSSVKSATECDQALGAFGAKLQSDANPCDTSGGSCPANCTVAVGAAHETCVGKNVTDRTTGAEVPYALTAFFAFGADFPILCSLALIDFAVSRDDLTCNDWAQLNVLANPICVLGGADTCSDQCKGLINKFYETCTEDETIVGMDGTQTTVKEVEAAQVVERGAKCNEHADTLEFKEVDPGFGNPPPKSPAHITSASLNYAFAAAFAFSFLCFV